MQAQEEINAKKQRLGAPEALALARQAADIYVAKGKKVVHLNLKRDQPDDATLTKLLLGPTGNLRAPTLRRGKTLVVGFDRQTYENVFG